MLLGDLDKAYSMITEVLNKVTNDGFMYFVAGKIRYLQKEYEDAKMYYIKSYELEKAPDTEHMLGMCYFELGEYEQANGIFKHMLEQNPLNVNLLLCSAKCYVKLDKQDEALATLDKIVETFPECEEAQEMIRAIS
jgi:TolA-binding protein